MNRRTFMASSAALALGASLGGCASRLAAPAAAARAGGKEAALRLMLDRFFYDSLALSPQAATSLALDTGPRAPLRAQLDDYSSAGQARDLALSEAQLAELRRFGRDGLSPSAALDYDVVEYDLARSIEGARRFGYGSSGGRYAPYVITQLSGAYRSIPGFLDAQHPIADASDAEAYVARLAQFPKALDDSLARQMQDASRGVFAPDYVLDTALRQMRSLRDQPAASTVMASSIRRRAAAQGLDPRYAAEAERIVASEVFPALDRHIAAVTDLRSRASHDAGVWRLPDGEAYYAAALKAATTTDITPDEVHALGLQQVAEIEAQLDPILRAHGLTQGTPGERLAALNKDPSQLFPNTDEGRAQLIALLNQQIARIYPRLPELFHTLPKASVVAQRVPELIQAGSAGAYYENAPIDGSRPGVYFINLRDTFDRPKFGLATLTAHEAVPGHHLQVMLAQESEEIPLIRRLGGYSAYSEGWALYAEQLVDEIGMYEGNPLERAGMLQSFLFRATRLVVDSGIHAKRWSREQATDYFLRTTGIARGRGQGEIDRYTVWPGQATSYKVGHMTWVRLRDEAKARLGERFDIRDFHSVLLQGSVPLTILERLVRDRIAVKLDTA